MSLAAGASAGELVERARIAVPEDVRVRFLMGSPDGRQLTAVCADRKLRVWSVGPPPALLRTLDVDGEGIGAIAYSDDGRRVAAGTRAGRAVVFSTSTGEVVSRIEGVGHLPDPGIGALALAPDGSRIALAPASAPAELWDVSPPRRRAVLAAAFGGSNAVAFSPNGARLASADEDAVVRIYDGEGTPRVTAEDLPLETFALAFSGDDRLLVGGADKTLTVVDTATGRVVRRLPRQPDAIAWLAPLRSGAAAVTGSFKDESMDALGPTLLWTIEGGDPRVLSATERFVGGARLKDGGLLMATAPPGAIVLWSLR